MHLINPYYVISNVIFIKPEKSMIIIERSCWNMIVSLIFRGRRPKRDEILRLKEACYAAYIAHINGIRIDFKKFNLAIASLQKESDEVSKFFQSGGLEKMQLAPSVLEIQPVEETYFDDEYVGPNHDNEKDLVKIRAVHSIIKKTEKNVTDRMNLEASYNEYSALLSETIGFGRYLTLMRQFVTLDYIPTLSYHELQFLIRNADLFSAVIRMKIGKKIATQFFSFFCTLCNKVGRHSTRVPGKQPSEHVCTTMTIWFDQFGIIPKEPAITFGANHIEVKSRNLIIQPGSDVNIRSVMHNEKRRASLESDLLTIARSVRNNADYVEKYKGRVINDFSQSPHAMICAVKQLEGELEDETFIKEFNAREFFKIDYQESDIEIIPKGSTPLEPEDLHLAENNANPFSFTNVKSEQPPSNFFSRIRLDTDVPAKCGKCGKDKTLLCRCRKKPESYNPFALLDK